MRLRLEALTLKRDFSCSANVIETRFLLRQFVDALHVVVA
jgi:hypothetical protein